MKYLISKTTEDGNIDSDEYHAGLLEYRNTPGNAGLSPAEIVFGHSLRSLVPAHHSNFNNKWKDLSKEWDEKMNDYREKAEFNYNKGAKDLTPIKITTNVYIQDPETKRWNRKGMVVGIGKFRNYLIKTTSGSLLWRNRRHLIPTTNDEVSREETENENEELSHQTRRSEREKKSPDRYVAKCDRYTV